MARSLALAAALAAAFTAPGAAARSFNCVITPAVTVKLGSPVSGLIDKVYVEPGDLVYVGDKIASLRSEVERTTVRLMEEQAVSMAEVEAQRARVSLAEKRRDRTRRLVERKITAAEELETAEAELEVLTRELAIAEMRQRVAMMELERAREQLSQRTITSTVDGVVTERALYSGEFLHQEAHVVTIAQIDPLTVEAFLPVNLYDRVQPGTAATVRPDAPVIGTYDGVVTVVDRVFDAASSTFGIRIRLANPGLRLPAGHRCTVTFEGVGDG